MPISILTICETQKGVTPQMSLKLLRVMAGLTQEELAKALDVVPSTISNWETGKTKPCKKHRNRLRAALHVTEDQLREELE